MNVERVQNPAKKLVLLAGAAAGSSGCNSHSACCHSQNSGRAQTGTLEGMRQVYRQLSASLPQLPR